MRFSIIEVFNKANIGFKGNTAAVIHSDIALSLEQMLHLAADLNQPATTFLWPADKENHYYTRWFAPDKEIGLCGHGSAAAVAFLQPKPPIVLQYEGGDIQAELKSDKSFSINLKAIPTLKKIEIPSILTEALGVEIQAYYTTNNKDIVLLKDEETLKKIKPNFEKLRQSKTFGYTLTAPGNNKIDFVSRTLIPHVQQLEDHATGSSHAALVPFWADRLYKNSFTALQWSKRGGYFECEYKKEQVILKGYFSILAEGKINL